MDFLQKFIAQLLEKFKLTSPVAFVVVAALLSAVKFLIDNGVFPALPEQASNWILWFIGLFLNAGTFKFLNQNK